MEAETPSTPKIGDVALHGLRPEHVKVDSATTPRGRKTAWIKMGAVTVYTASFDEIVAIAEQLKVLAMRAKAQDLLANAPFRGDAA